MVKTKCFCLRKKLLTIQICIYIFIFFLNKNEITICCSCKKVFPYHGDYRIFWINCLLSFSFSFFFLIFTEKGKMLYPFNRFEVSESAVKGDSGPMFQRPHNTWQDNCPWRRKSLKKTCNTCVFWSCYE